jgi:hypothetical protein
MIITTRDIINNTATKLRITLKFTCNNVYPIYPIFQQIRRPSDKMRNKFRSKFYGVSYQPSMNKFRSVSAIQKIILVYCHNHFYFPNEQILFSCIWQHCQPSYTFELIPLMTLTSRWGKPQGITGRTVKFHCTRRLYCNFKQFVPTISVKLISVIMKQAYQDFCHTVWFDFGTTTFGRLSHSKITWMNNGITEWVVKSPIRNVELCALLHLMCYVISW